MNLVAVYERLDARLATIDGLRHSPFPPAAVNVPHAFPEWPDGPDYDLSYDRGLHRLTVPVRVVVCPLGSVDRAAFAAVSAYANATGERSVKAALEADDDATEFQVIAVTRASFGVVTIAAIDYYSASFDVTIWIGAS